jgi:hypothetical protein
MGSRITSTDWFRQVNRQPIVPTVGVSGVTASVGASGNARYNPGELRISFTQSVSDGKGTGLASIHVTNKFPIQITNVEFLARASSANGSVVFKVGGGSLCTIAAVTVSTRTEASTIAENKRIVNIGSTITMVAASSGVGGVAVISFNPLVTEPNTKSVPTT